MSNIRFFFNTKSYIFFRNDLTCKLAETNTKNLESFILPLLKNTQSLKRQNQINKFWSNLVSDSFFSFPTSLDPNWVVGLVDGYRSFFVSIIRPEGRNIGYLVLVLFAITQYGEPDLFNQINQ